MFDFSDLELQLSIALSVVSFIVSLFVFGISKKLFLAFVVFSVLGNLSFLINMESRMFHGPHYMIWLKYFTFPIWPIINIALIIKYRKSKKCIKN